MIRDCGLFFRITAILSGLKIICFVLAYNLPDSIIPYPSDPCQYRLCVIFCSFWSKTNENRADAGPDAVFHPLSVCSVYCVPDGHPLKKPGGGMLLRSFRTALHGLIRADPGGWQCFLEIFFIFAKNKNRQAGFLVPALYRTSETVV